MEEVLWGTLTGTDICFYGPLRIAGCFICVYMAHVSTRSHSFWRDGTDCKRALETAQNYAYIKHQISTGKNQSKQTHEMTCSQHRLQFSFFWFELFNSLCLFGCSTSPANQPFCFLIRPIHHGKDESWLGKGWEGGETCTILFEGLWPAKHLNWKKKMNYALLPLNLFLCK